MTDKRIISKNPNRCEDNKDLFDHMCGQFVVTWMGVSGSVHTEMFSYSGNNMLDSEVSRREVLMKAQDFKKAFVPFAVGDVMIDEIN